MWRERGAATLAAGGADGDGGACPGSEGELALLDADEEEGRPIGVGTPDDRLHVQGTALRRAELEEGLAAHRKLILEPDLRTDRTQIQGVAFVAPSPRLDGDGPHDTGTRVSPEISSEVAHGLSVSP